MTKNTINPPADLPLSSKVKALRKAWQDAESKLSEYKSENARYRTRDVSQVGEIKARYSTPALVAAEKELKEQEIAAVAAGKALPDREAILGPIRVKIADYERTVSALSALVSKAHSEFVEGVKAELVVMGLKEATKAAKARDDWEKAHNAAIAARETLEKHAGLFAWCATSGDTDSLPLTGASAGNNAEYWELSADGRLTTEAAIALGFEGVGVIDGLIVMPAPVKDEQAEAEAEFWRTYKPKMFLANPDGFANWEH
ncbi:hypothetical protein ABZS79_30210 [Streptomyces griseoloalbus]|uniref:hypothetical protein n=1 Tax=Streptomyces griseoloalbus TaxID=67303 RepID=UPI0033AC7086